MFERGMAWLVLRDPPNHDASASHCRSLVYVGARPVFLFPALYSPAYVYKAGEFFGHEAALGNIQCSTHVRNRIASSHRLNQTVSHRDSLAKYVAHFFIKSRSIFTSTNSRLTPGSSNSTSVSGF